MLTKTGAYLRRNHLGVLALVIAMSGGAYAASIPRNSVDTQHLKDGAVTKPKLAANAVNSSKVAAGSLMRSDFKKGQVPSVHFALVNESGNIIRQSGGLQARLETNGGTNAQYRVTLPTAVSNCTFQATAGDPNQINSNQFVIPRVTAVAPSSESNKTVAVQLYYPDSNTGEDWWHYVQDAFWFAAFCK